MSEIVNWIINQLLTQWIAIFTAITSFLVWKNDHSKLIVDSDNIAEPIAGILLDDGESIINWQDSMQHLTLWLINPSANDVSYYDLRMLSDTDEIDYYTSVKFNYSNNLLGKKAEALIPYEDGTPSSNTIAIEIPEKNHGTIPSHGFVQIDLVFHADHKYEDGMIVMKLSLPHNLWSRFRHSKYAPKFLHPKLGYLYSETQEIALSFQVRDIQQFDP